MKGSRTLLAGTSKGLVVYRKVNGNWEAADIFFRGMPLTLVYVDRRTNTWWAGIVHRHWGQKLHRSADEGKNWTEVKAPKYPETTKLSSGKSATLKKIWTIEQAGSDRPNGLWIGTEPGGLFYSEDNGESFFLVESLWNHPSRSDENQWFGAGRDHPFIHSVVVDPRDSDHVYIAVSCAGVFETRDGGKNWNPQNKGLIAAYLPNPNVEVGHDPHRMLLCEANPDVLWQQNHCGVFRSTDAGENWANVTDEKGLANYGFALAVDAENPLRAWTIPAISDLERVAPDLALCVCHTQDGGISWQALRKGLPQKNTFDIVFRHSFDNCQETMAFGTTNGNLYLSENYGESWKLISNNLARVESIFLYDLKSTRNQ